ncbi:hypothetical protein TCDM_10004 [Trypanosoma cruzi Dm28c]|uniref:Uncharacterized protein n=1 Tax=Trypanosoma cruzi Dm28c TaxID=1416333 RepID=V5B406_TRYCR|nr:hypothetical protein TCDM_10004 [Trypanosoma cruzi Dm28c]
MRGKLSTHFFFCIFYFCFLLLPLENIEREGLLPFCFICPLCLTASFTPKCSSAPQLSLSIACANFPLLFCIDAIIFIY